MERVKPTNIIKYCRNKSTGNELSCDFGTQCFLITTKHMWLSRKRTNLIKIKSFLVSSMDIFRTCLNARRQIVNPINDWDVWSNKVW